MTKKTTPESTPQTPTPAPAAAVPAKKSNKTLWIVLGIVLFFVVIVPGLLFAAAALWVNNNGSEKLTENVIESALEKSTGSKVDIDTKDGNVSVKSSDGDNTVSYGNDQKLPSDFPKDITHYIDGGDITFVISNKDADQKKSWSVTTKIDKSYDDTKAYFESKIAQPEYESTSTYSFGNSVNYYGSKSGYSVSVNITKGEDATSVSYLVSEK